MSKRDWLDRPAKRVPCKIVIDAAIYEEQLHPLTDADVHAGELAFAKADDDTPEIASSKDEQRAYFLAAVGLGYDNFLAQDPVGMALELKAKKNCPTITNIGLMVDALVERYTLTVAKLEEDAKTSIRPTESAG